MAKDSDMFLFNNALLRSLFENVTSILSRIYNSFRPYDDKLTLLRFCDYQVVCWWCLPNYKHT